MVSDYVHNTAKRIVQTGEKTFDPAVADHASILSGGLDFNATLASGSETSGSGSPLTLVLVPIIFLFLFGCLGAAYWSLQSSHKESVAAKARTPEARQAAEADSRVVADRKRAWAERQATGLPSTKWIQSQLGTSRNSPPENAKESFESSDALKALEVFSGEVMPRYNGGMAFKEFARELAVLWDDEKRTSQDARRSDVGLDLGAFERIATHVLSFKDKLSKNADFSVKLSDSRFASVRALFSGAQEASAKLQYAMGLTPTPAIKK